MTGTAGFFFDAPTLTAFARASYDLKGLDNAALLYAAIPLGWWLAGPQIWLVYLVSTLGAGLGMCFQVAYIAAVANLVDRDQMRKGCVERCAALFAPAKITACHQ